MFCYCVTFVYLTHYDAKEEQQNTTCPNANDPWKPNRKQNPSLSLALHKNNQQNAGAEVHWTAWPVRDSSLRQQPHETPTKESHFSNEGWTVFVSEKNNEQKQQRSLVWNRTRFEMQANTHTHAHTFAFKSSLTMTAGANECWEQTPRHFAKMITTFGMVRCGYSNSNSNNNNYLIWNFFFFFLFFVGTQRSEYKLS